MREVGNEEVSQIRKLAAILAADVVDFSRLTGADVVLACFAPRTAEKLRVR
jgi:class 3 adenylate cyclase